MKSSTTLVKFHGIKTYKVQHVGDKQPNYFFFLTKIMSYSKDHIKYIIVVVIINSAIATA